MKKVIIGTIVIGWRSSRIKEERAKQVALNRVLITIFTGRIARIRSHIEMVEM